MAFVMIFTTSCEDSYIANKLDGIWEGEVASEYFNYRWQEWGTEFQSVDIEFYKDPFRYSSGRGIEYDYQRGSYGRYYYVECPFSYTVSNGVIYLSYDGDPVQVAIYNYRLSNNHFIGDFHNRVTGKFLASFDFIKVGNWRYQRGDGYYNYDSYYDDYYDYMGGYGYYGGYSGYEDYYRGRSAIGSDSVRVVGKNVYYKIPSPATLKK